MNSERIAWTAFKLNGSVEAYLLHASLAKLDKKNEEDQWTRQMD